MYNNNKNNDDDLLCMNNVSIFHNLLKISTKKYQQPQNTITTLVGTIIITMTSPQEVWNLNFPGTSGERVHWSILWLQQCEKLRRHLADTTKINWIIKTRMPVSTNPSWQGIVTHNSKLCGYFNLVNCFLPDTSMRFFFLFFAHHWTFQSFFEPTDAIPTRIAKPEEVATSTKKVVCSNEVF